MQGVERLSIVSKVLFDSRLMELRRENEALRLEQKRAVDTVKLEQKHTIDTLKLKVFWSQHDDLHLRQHLAWANDSSTGPNCCCGGCYWNGRFDYTETPKPVYPYMECRFMPWFENEIVQFGLTSSVRHGNAHTTHFALHHEGQCEFARWLLQITTCEHPELRKVHELFSHLRGLVGITDRPGLWESYWA
jgi:hypothetical protein